jgi:hypothetical protein
VLSDLQLIRALCLQAAAGCDLNKQRIIPLALLGKKRPARAFIYFGICSDAISGAHFWKKSTLSYSGSEGKRKRENTFGITSAIRLESAPAVLLMERARGENKICSRAAHAARCAANHFSQPRARLSNRISRAREVKVQNYSIRGEKNWSSAFLRWHWKISLFIKKRGNRLIFHQPFFVSAPKPLLI